MCGNTAANGLASLTKSQITARHVLSTGSGLQKQPAYEKPGAAPLPQELPCSFLSLTTCINPNGCLPSSCSSLTTCVSLIDSLPSSYSSLTTCVSPIDSRPSSSSSGLQPEIALCCSTVSQLFLITAQLTRIRTYSLLLLAHGTRAGASFHRQSVLAAGSAVEQTSEEATGQRSGITDESYTRPYRGIKRTSRAARGQMPQEAWLRVSPSYNCQLFLELLQPEGLAAVPFFSKLLQNTNLLKGDHLAKLSAHRELPFFAKFPPRAPRA